MGSNQLNRANECFLSRPSMLYSMSNNVDEVSPMEFRKLCNLLETIFAQTVSCEVYELFEERCCGYKLNRSSQSECLMLSYEERSQMYDLEAIERVSKKDVVWNKFVEVTKVLELEWDENVFEYWNQLRRDPMYVKSMMSVENSDMLSILDQLCNCKEDCCDDPLEPGAMVFFSMPPSFKYTVKATGEQFRSHEEDHYKAYVEYLRSRL